MTTASVVQETTKGQAICPYCGVGCALTYYVDRERGAIAFAVHRWLGLKFLSKSWFNLDRAWAASLALVGAVSLAAILAGGE